MRLSSGAAAIAIGTALATTIPRTDGHDALLTWITQANMSIQAGIIPGRQGVQPPQQSGDVRQALAAASRATGVDFAYLTANASLESSLNPDAKARTSSAAGLFQFIESTWEDMVERHGAKIGLADEAKLLKSGAATPADRQRIMDLRFDPDIAARMGAEFTAENADYLRGRLDREPADVDLYLAHFLGPASAAKFLDRLESRPDAAAADAFPAAARANRAVFYDGARARSFEEIHGRFDAKLADRADDLKAPAPGAGLQMMAKASAPPPPVENARAFTSVSKPGAASGDPYMTTLITAQLSMNDSLSRVRTQDGDRDQSFRNLLS